MREEWGCDVETKRLQVIYGCPTCPDGEDPKCPTCKGEDEWTTDRCPLAQHDRDAARVVMHAEMLMSQVSAMPVGGGWNDQAAVWCDLVLFATRPLSRYHGEERERERREAEREARRQGSGR